MLHAQNKPSLSTSKVWSPTDMYEFVPVSASWAAGTVTFKFTNHGLTSTDVITVVCADTTSDWNMGDKVATVVDANTFTVPLASDPSYFPNEKPYAQDNVWRRVTINVRKYSRTFYLQDYVQIDSLGTMTGIQLQVKLNESANWISLAAPLDAIPVGITKLTDKYNFMRLTHSGGTTVTLPTVYTQKNVY